MFLNQQQKRDYLQRIIECIDKSKIRSDKKPSRFYIDNEYVHGGYVATFPKYTPIFLTLLVHCNKDLQVSFPSISKIQELSGCTNRNTVIKAIKTLKEYGVINVVRPKGFNMVNVYVFQSHIYWKPISGWKEKLEKYNNKSQYQFIPHRNNKKSDYRSNRVDTLTNLSDNSPNKLTSIGDVLKDRIREWQIPEKVAIQSHSGDTIVGSEGKEFLPVNTGKIREVTVDNTTQKQRYRSINGDTAMIEEKLEKGLTNNMGHTPNDPNIKSAYE